MAVQPAGAAPQDAMRRQRTIFLAAFALLGELDAPAQPAGKFFHQVALTVVDPEPGLIASPDGSVADACQRDCNLGGRQRSHRDHLGADEARHRAAVQA